MALLGLDFARGMDLGEKLCEALGLDANMVSRIILDVNINAGHLVMVYVEMYGGEKLLEVDWAAGLEGAEIRGVDKCES